MPQIRVVFLWHMHQPFYKDLGSGEYRLPWVRMHALKDYYGMVKLLDEFPGVHQTFNLVPSLVAQIQDYVAGTARDPLLELVSRPAQDLSRPERLLALDYLFLANSAHLIGRYPRYQELHERLRGSGTSAQALSFFTNEDFADLQVLSQLAWFDEFFLADPDIAALISKGRNFDSGDQRLMLEKQREILASVLPAYAEAAGRGAIEISTSPYYHPILPLLCDTDVGAVSSPGLPLPQSRFRHPEDAREQLRRGLNAAEQTFRVRPQGVWPSEGSVSEEVFAIAHSLGVQWMASDEGVLGRSIDFHFSRDLHGRLTSGGPERLYTPWLYEKGETRMQVLFRDHALSDLIGFVYARMPAAEAAHHLIRSIKESAEPVLQQGKDAIVPIILDGENAWEHYPESGREFLRRVYDALQDDPALEAVTASEALQRHREPARLHALSPGSWINANFNIWIGAPEDNRSWDALTSARAFYESAAPLVSEAQRKLAYEDVLIAEGSDWNWWYGPEHHTANDRDFDELYRHHLSNIYQALGASPPLYLAQPIMAATAKPVIAAQTAYIHPHIRADFARYFDWVGAAMYAAERHGDAMHGKTFYLEAIYAGIDEKNLYGRLDFVGGIPDEALELVVNCRSVPPGAAVSPSDPVTPTANANVPGTSLLLEAAVEARRMSAWTLRSAGMQQVIATSADTPENGARVSLFKNFEFQVPLKLLNATFGWTIQL
ncbi:MAG: glycoside hydrolase family 57 protein, partial [Candidatus Korobacteraceae bacterium]